MVLERKGFTLLEVTIAMAIMVISFSAILMVESGGIRSSMKARNFGVVAMLMKRAMIDAEFEIEGKTFSEISNETEGQFDEPFQDFRWTRSIKEIQFPTFGTEEGEDAKTDIQGMISKVIAKFLSDAVREVTVTILWKKGKGMQSYSVSTYWINLKEELKLSE